MYLKDKETIVITKEALCTYSKKIKVSKFKRLFK